MKFISFLFVLLFAQTLFAQSVCGGIGGDSGGPKVSWKSILKCKSLYADFPNIEIEGQKISYDQLCVMGEKIRTIRKVPVNYGNIQNGPIYVKQISFYDYLTTDQIQERLECARYNQNGSCQEYVNVRYEIPTTSEINVYLINDDTTLDLFFDKEFELPDCDSLDTVEI